MAIYRGTGLQGEGGISDFSQLVQDAQDAAAAAEQAYENTLEIFGDAEGVAAAVAATQLAETNAETAEANAELAETNAETAATNAANSASAASTSATNAASSATSASNSASTATTQATNASNSATAAATSASNASTSATNAANSATTAINQATNAATSATSAANSATTATNSANTAISKANEASASASAASASASSASSSAVLAATSAAEAIDHINAALDLYNGAAALEDAVDAAQASATASANSETAAATSATNAANSATTAAGYAASINPSLFVHLADTETITGHKTFSINPTLSGGTANGVAYLNGSKVLTTGSALTFDGTSLGVGIASPTSLLQISSASPAISSIESDAAADEKNYRIAQYAGKLNWELVNDANSNSYRFLEVDRTGISVDYVAFFTGNNTEQMRLTSTGLGIGTSSPAQKLHISGAAGVSGEVTARLENTSTANKLIQLMCTGSSYNYAGIGANQAAIYTYGNNLTMCIDGVGAFTVATNATERMRIDSSGNVGIGTSSPGYPLAVNGLIHTQGTNAGLSIARRDTSAQSWLWYSAAGNLQAYDVVAASTRMTLDSSGNLGLGVTPSAWSSGYKAFQVNTTASIAATTSAMRLSNNAYVNASGFDAYLTTAAATVYIQNSGAHSWYTAPSGTAGTAASFTQAMTLDASGNLLVGTTSVYNSARLSVNAGGSSGSIALSIGNANDTYYAANFRNSSGTSVGNVSCTTSATAYNTSSDYRLKENIQPMQNALGVVAQLNPVTYTWKADGSDGQGFIAHELQAVVPDCVTGEKDAVDAEGKPVYQGIDTSFLVATLTKAIQEQQELINQLTARVAQLEGN